MSLDSLKEQTHRKVRAPGRDEHSTSNEPNYDPDVSHGYHHGHTGALISPAGVNPEFDDIEYEDDSVPPDLH